MMTMLRSLLPVLLLTLVYGAAPPPTFRDTDPITGAPLECDRCPPGTYLRARCTSTQRSKCAPCPSGSFTELWNYIGKCLRCGVCGQNQVEKTACNAESDCQCECKQGYYYKQKYDMCLPHSVCPAGQGVLTRGTPQQDTVCHDCSNTTFSDVNSALQNCTEHKACDAAGQQLLLRGASWHDSVCTSCQSTDGADYLKEILPAFFVHQKMHSRRLRHILNKLPSENSRRLGATSGLSGSDLLERINTWASSATAAQIRQLPAVLKKAGATGSSEKLQNKLRRIDDHLTERCLSNVVEEVFLPL
ncbi:tumor necrosis factor receptor superfamily member 6B-like isoform X2 [Pagrus major]|uniref:tumor necrosis factor receptor superfamily member 6B-like isoform X2 n=1 Tax=Pagrus major TaxID=143350 RepID=UPI003CC856C2